MTDLKKDQKPSNHTDELYMLYYYSRCVMNKPELLQLLSGKAFSGLLKRGDARPRYVNVIF